jgi:hypothetical protein
MIKVIRVRRLLFAWSLFAVPGAEAVGPLQFYSVTPCRLVDTRDPNGVTGGPILSHGVVRNFAVYGSNSRNCGIPNDLQKPVKAVTLNVTVINPSSLGHLTVFPYNTSIPVVSTINYAAGEPALGNGAIVPLTNDANLQISVLPVLVGAGNTVSLVLDVTGYFQ